MDRPVQWLTTAPNPRRRHTGGPDAGQRGWKRHAVIADDTQSFESIKDERAMCGLRADHGWDIDLFIEDECERCRAALGNMKTKTIRRLRPQRAWAIIIPNTGESEPFPDHVPYCPVLGGMGVCRLEEIAKLSLKELRKRGGAWRRGRVAEVEIREVKPKRAKGRGRR